MDFKSKIDKILKVKKVKLWKLAEDSGLGTTLEKAYSENRDMRDSSTERFLQNLGINPEWWKGNSGDVMLQISHKRETPETAGKVPFYDAVAVGGHALLADQTPISEPAEYVNPGDFLKTATGTLRVYGHSGFPKYPAGSIIAFKETKSNTIHYGEDYVIELDDRRVIKRVQRSKKEGHIQLNSYNTMKDDTGSLVYAPYEISLAEIKRMNMVLGLVILEASV
jgi:hypothetical protein